MLSFQVIREGRTIQICCDDQGVDALIAVNDGGMAGEHLGGAFQEGQRRQRLKIGRHPVQPGFIGVPGFCDVFALWFLLGLLWSHGASTLKKALFPDKVDEPGCNARKAGRSSMNVSD